MSDDGLQGSGKNRGRKPDEEENSARPNATAKADSAKSVLTSDSGRQIRERLRAPLQLFKRKGVGDIYDLDSLSYRLEKPVGSGSGEAAGKSEVWRATRVGPSEESVFLKKFSSPKYPTSEERDDPNYGPELLKRCERFASRHQTVSKRLSQNIVGSGALVKPLDFGIAKETVTYLKVYPWVPNANVLSRDLVEGWSVSERVTFLRTLLLGLWELHALGIVHGDIKRENILVVERPVGHVARLIDFDEAFLAESPPLTFEDGEVGTTLMTPEWRVLEHPELARDGVDLRLGTATDIFQLAIVLEEVFGAGTPTWSLRGAQSFNDHAEASLLGAEPTFSDLGLPFPRISQQLQRAADLNPIRRPTIKSLLSTIGVNVG